MIKTFSPTSILLAALGAAALTGACDSSKEAERAREAEREAQQASDHAARAQAQANEADRQARAAAIEAERAREVARQQQQQQQMAAPATMAFNQALDNIAGSRCDRELRCGNVGTGKRYESVQACHAVVRNSFATDLNAADCPSGIDQRELAECMQEVRDENCSNPLDTLGRIAACRTSDMCRSTPVVGGP
jgi:hypothetical protein